VNEAVEANLRMDMDPNLSPDKPLRTPEVLDVAQAALPALPDRAVNIPWPDMPEKMLITIDGWQDTPKALVGEWVAIALGGLFVNSEQIYRTLVAASVKAGVDVRDPERVQSWCEQAGVDIGFADRGGWVLEAHVAVNGLWFTKSELGNRTEQVLNRAALHHFWEKVRQVIRRCDFNDRVVIVGSDVGHEFPRTPYKFFLDATAGKRDPLELAGYAYPWFRDRKKSEEGELTHFDHGTKTLVADASLASPDTLVAVVLVESVAHACDLGFVGGKRESVLAHACFLVDETRARMRAVLSRTSNSHYDGG
jgi:cytidylate kinase